VPDGYIHIYVCVCIDEGRVYNNNARRPLCDIITICAGNHASWLYCECSLKSSEDSYLSFLSLQDAPSLFFSYSSFDSSITSLNSCFSIMFCFFSSHYETIIDNNSRRRLTVIVVSGIELYIRARFTPLKYISIYT
jgi:hypothetical protein